MQAARTPPKLLLLVVITVLLLTSSVALAAIHSNDPETRYVFVPEEEPWYLANPVSRIIFTFLSTGYNLIRLDRIFEEQPGTYVGPWVNSGSDFIGHSVGIVADLANDVSHGIQKASAYFDGYTASETVFQCTSPLPLGNLYLLGEIAQLKHTWLQIGRLSYGMPYPETATIQWGGTGIHSPDPYLLSLDRPSAAVCTPIFRPELVNENAFSERFQCIADNLATNGFIAREIAVQIDYNVFLNNCMAAVRFIAECAGGKVSQIPNLGIGSSFDLDDPVNFFERDEFATQMRIDLLDHLRSLTQVFSENRINPTAIRGLTQEEFVLFRRLQEKLLEYSILRTDTVARSMKRIVTIQTDKLIYQDACIIIADLIIELRKDQMNTKVSYNPKDGMTYRDACESARKLCGDS